MSLKKKKSVSRSCNTTSPDERKQKYGDLNFLFFLVVDRTRLARLNSLEDAKEKDRWKAKNGKRTDEWEIEQFINEPKRQNKPETR